MIVLGLNPDFLVGALSRYTWTNADNTFLDGLDYIIWTARG